MLPRTRVVMQMVKANGLGVDWDQWSPGGNMPGLGQLSYENK